MDNNRIVALQTAQERGHKKFALGDNELSIMRTIQTSSYVKRDTSSTSYLKKLQTSRQDFIDQITNKFNINIEAICSSIVIIYSEVSSTQSKSNLSRKKFSQKEVPQGQLMKDFSNFINKIYSELSHLLLKMDDRIMKEEQEVEMKRQVQRRKELQEQHEMQRQEDEVAQNRNNNSSYTP